MDDQQRNTLTKAREHYKRKEFDRAKHLLEKLVESGVSSYADVHNMLGVIHHDAGDLARAQEQFEAALRINPNYTEAILNLTVTYNEIGRYEDARRLMEHLGQRKTDDSPDGLEPYARGKIANLHADVAQAYYDVGMLSAAIEELNKAIVLCGDFVDLRVRLGNMLTEAQRVPEATKQYEEAVRIKPEYHQAKIQLGIAYLKAGRKPEAINLWRSVLEKDPASRSARMYLRLAGEKTDEKPGA
ncbi:MAG: tetratricopeptide repeat protein [Deltaproteobacteria bacterium]|nr:tetratricopeptide repeat protein [Deltaproteobacteria bacterium]